MARKFIVNKDETLASCVCSTDEEAKDLVKQLKDKGLQTPRHDYVEEAVPAVFVGSKEFAALVLAGESLKGYKEAYSRRT